MGHLQNLRPSITYDNRLNGNKNRHFLGIDLFKLIMAICVIFIHVDAVKLIYKPQTMPVAIMWFTRLAVPFFFISSGFLLANKLKILGFGTKLRSQYILKRAMMIARIFLYWLMIYLPLTIYNDIHGNYGLQYSVISYFETLIFKGESYFAWPLWFLYSMSIVLMIYGLLYKKKHIEWILFTFFAFVLTYNYMFTNGLFPEIAVNAQVLLNKMTDRPLKGGGYISWLALLYTDKSNIFLLYELQHYSYLAYVYSV